ncbi:MAG: type VI secretion system-associated protein TagF [Desulfosarcinaceae bacterium]
MLGLTQDSHWCWTVVGKHPAAADYINIDGGSPLMDALADWMAKGYDEINRTDRAGAGTYSWRFWLRGARKGGLVCGVVRDSSDRIGRPFPLLILGEGGLKKWEKQWELLPADLIKVWQRMESIAAHRYDDLNALADALRALVPPNGPTLPGRGEAVAVAGEMPSGLDECRLQLRDNGRAMVHLRPSGDMDALDSARQWHLLLKACCADVPRAVFWGGTPARTYMAVFSNALSTQDFVKLWTI